MAYVSDESGRPQVYVQSFPPSRSKWQISNNGGRQPKWRRDGKELFFFSLAGEMMAVDIETVNAAGANATFKAGLPRKLFPVNVPPLGQRNSYDPVGDGQRFLVNSVPAQASTSALTVILNWTAALKR